ncbi:MAG: hypothetical protein K6G87_03875, partial [Butyrivibrio sp.]|uniref:hypothetical protein n=1 Tax=Butyrivibrio sp. TaxID=28121 RepID=UPI0025EA1F50
SKKNSSNSSSESDATSTGSSSTGNNTAPAADPYAEYKTGDPEVDAEIDRLFEEYGDDLSESYEDENFSWENASNTTRRALSRIVEVDLEKIEYSFSDDECANCLERVETILTYMVTLQGSSDQTVFNSGYLNEMYGYMTNGIAKNYINEFGALQRSDYDYIQGYSLPEIWIDRAGVCFGFEDGYGNVTEMLYHTSIARTNKYIDKCEKENPGCFDHLKNDIGFDNNYIVSMYMDCKNSYDMTLIDKLAKTDGNYSDVFVVDPEKISTECSYRLADYSYQLLSKEEYNEYLNYANGILVPGVKYPESDEYAKGYLEIMTIYSGDIAEKLKKGAWTKVNNNISYYDEELDHQLFLANSNEAFWTKVYYEYDEGGLGQRSTVCYDASERQPGDDFNTYMPYLTMIPSSYGGNLPFFDEQGQMQFYYNVKATHYYGYDSVEDITTSKDTHLLNAGSLDFIKGLEDYDDNWLEELERKRREKLTSQSEDTVIAIVKAINPQVGTLLAISKEIYESDMLGTGKTAAEAIKTYYDGAPDGAVIGGRLTAAGLDAYVKFTKIQEEYEETKKRIDATTKLMLGYSAVSGSPKVSISEYSNIREYVRWSSLGINAIYKDAEITGDFVDHTGQPYNTACSLLEAHREDVINMAYKDLEDDTVSYTQEQVTQAYNSLIRSNAGDNDNYPVGDYKAIQDIPYDLFLALVKACDKFLPSDKTIESAYNKAVGNI